MSAGLAVALRELRHQPEVWRARRRPGEEVERRALHGTNAMLDHCRRHVPYYQDHPSLPSRLTSLAELSRLPLLSKRAVLDDGVERFRQGGLRPSCYRTDVTSGTTGARLEIWHDIDAYGYHGATVFRRFLLSGYRPWWRIAHIKPFPRPVRWFQRLGLFPRVVVGAGQDDAVIAAEVLRIRPHLVMGYPVVLRGLLRALDAGDLARLRTTLRIVMTDSELLTPEVAERLEHGFGVPVLDEYSAYEVLTVSTQCRHGCMHIDEDRVWVEIVDEEGQRVADGCEGEVVVTHFRERAMPLLRYRLGDRAAIVSGACGCGSSFRRMRLVDGRTNDYIVLPGGRRVYSGVFLSLAMFTPGVAECMVRQSATGEITVHLVAESDGRRAFDDAVGAFQSHFARLVDQPVALRFERVERVELTPGGKGKFVESSYRPERA